MASPRVKTYIFGAGDLPFAQSMGFAAGSVIVDNPTNQYLFFPTPISRFIPPSGNAVIIAGVEQASFVWQAPVGQTQPASSSRNTLTLTLPVQKPAVTVPVIELFLRK